jgi:hypothetical protein
VRLPFFAGPDGHLAIEAHFMNKCLSVLKMVSSKAGDSDTVIHLTDTRLIYGIECLDSLILGLTAFREELQKRANRGDIR